MSSRWVGPYRLLAPLGRGGMAETWLAERVFADGSRREVCVKQMLESLEHDAALRADFEREARAASQLVHGHIVWTFDHGTHEGRPYIVMEVVRGTDLRKLLRATRRSSSGLSLELLGEVAFGLVAALGHAHARDVDGRSLGIIHRDLSPSNVLLGTSGEVKLADFGIAKVAGQSHATRTGLLRGKVPYMAPEYVRGGEATPSADWFALGVVLFECLVPYRPYDGAHEAETLENLAHGNRRRLREVASVPAELAAFVDALLDPDPRVRPADEETVRRGLVSITPTSTSRLALADAVEALALAPATEAPRAPSDPAPAPAEHAPSPAGPDAPTRTRRADG